MKNKKGFTLIELILSIALLSIISSGILLLFNSALDTWLFGHTYIRLQETASESMDALVEGRYRYDGLREILDIIEVKDESISFLPWWEQSLENVAPGKKYPLNKTRKPGSPIPVAQYWSETKKEYILTHISFFPGDTEYVLFENIPHSVRARIFYYPLKDSESIMKVYLDRENNSLFREYKGKTTPLMRTDPDIRLSGFQLEYLDGTNNPIPYGIINQSPQTPVTAIRINITASSGPDSYTLRTFVNIRKKGVASEGILLTDGARLKIPDSKNIKTLSLINFFGIKEDSFFSCTIYSPSQNQSYHVKVEFTLKNGIPWITRYSVEFPKGKKRYDRTPDIPASRGINFLTLDYSGVYDYGYDENLEEQVDFRSQDTEFIVEKSTVQGAYLLVR